MPAEISWPNILGPRETKPHCLPSCSHNQFKLDPSILWAHGPTHRIHGLKLRSMDSNKGGGVGGWGVKPLLNYTWGIPLTPPPPNLHLQLGHIMSGSMMPGTWTLTSRTRYICYMQNFLICIQDANLMEFCAYVEGIPNFMDGIPDFMGIFNIF